MYLSHVIMTWHDLTGMILHGPPQTCASCICVHAYVMQAARRQYMEAMGAAGFTNASDVYIASGLDRAGERFWQVLLLAMLKGWFICESQRG